MKLNRDGKFGDVWDNRVGWYNPKETSPDEILSKANSKINFDDLDVSRQEKYQLKRKLEGKCVICGQPTEDGRTNCNFHRDKARERYQRKRAQ